MASGLLNTLGNILTFGALGQSNAQQSAMQMQNMMQMMSMMQQQQAFAQQQQAAQEQRMLQERQLRAMEERETESAINTLEKTQIGDIKRQSEIKDTADITKGKADTGTTYRPSLTSNSDEEENELTDMWY